MPQKTEVPQIAKLEKGFKLAEQWVNNMTKCPEDKPTEVESEGRPPRLGLGARVLRQAKVRHSNDPVERKLLAKLNAMKREAAKTNDESTQQDDNEDDEDNEDSESRTNAFAKRSAATSPSLQPKKKQK